MFIFQVNLGMWPSNWLSWKIKSCSEGFNTHLWGSKEIDQKMFILRVNLGMLTPQINLRGKMSHVLRVSTHIYGDSKEIDGKTIIFESKPRHVTPQIDWLGPVLSIPTHIYGISKVIDGKMFIYQVNLGMWPLKLICWENEPCSEGLNTHLWGFQGDRWENVHFESKPRHVTPQIDLLGKMRPILMVWTCIYVISKEMGGKPFIFIVNLGMWPLNSIFLENWAWFWGFNTHLWDFQGERWKTIHF